MNEKYKRLGKNTLIFGISSFGTKFLSFLLIPLYTNVLTTAEYGTADLITTTATLLIYVLTINIADSVLRFTIERKSGQNEILSYGIRVLVIGNLWCASILGIIYITGMLAWPLYYYLFILFYFLSTALYHVLANYLRGIDKVMQVAVAGIISTGTIIAGSIFFLIIFKIGIIGYLLSLILGPLVAALYCFAVINEPLGIYLRNLCNREIQTEMRAYCIPLIFNNVALWINAFLDRYFVTGYCGVGENGIYSVANKIPTILATCYTIFSQAWNLSAIKEFDPEDKDGFFSKTYQVYNALITVACSALILANIPFARFLYANKFFPAWQYSSVLLLSVMFNSLTIIIGSIFSAVKQTKVIATTTVLSAIVNIVLNMLLIPIWGALGAAIATAIAYFAMWFVRLWFSRKYIRLRVNLFCDCSVYAILMMQVVLEHMSGHMYVGQAACLIAIIVIYHRYLWNFFEKLLKTCKR